MNTIDKKPGFQNHNPIPIIRLIMLLGGILGIFFFLGCVNHVEGTKVPVSPTEIGTYPTYNLVLVRTQGLLDVQENVKKHAQGDITISLADMARDSFLSTFQNFDHPNVHQFIFIDPAEIGFVDTILSEEPSENEAVTREPNLELTSFAQERMTQLDLDGVFVIDIKKAVIEYNHQSKFGRFWTYSVIGTLLIFGPVVWAVGDYDLSMSVEFHYLNRDNSHAWRTLDPYDDLAGNKILKSMPHGIDFEGLNRKELLNQEQVEPKVKEVLDLYTDYALATFFQTDVDIERFKGGKTYEP